MSSSDERAYHLTERGIEGRLMLTALENIGKAVIMGQSNKLRSTDETSGVVFNIQRYSTHDGHGIRTLVFMKGCPLKCKWCSNPEGQKTHSEVGFIDALCVGSGQCDAPCVKACSVQAITLSAEGKPYINREICGNCGECAQACYYGARKAVGKRMTVEEVLAEVEKDKTFYRTSGGGVTIGGGEPASQPEFVIELLRKCRQRYLHTAIETCGHAPWKSLEKVLENADLIYYDIKQMDPAKHKKMTGVSNKLILKNIAKILSDKKHPEIIVRVPVVLGCNDSEENIKATARFVAESGGEMIELLPYHKFGTSKYGQYGMKYELTVELEPPTQEEIQHLRELVESFGLKEMTGAL